VGMAKHYIIEALEREIDQVGREWLEAALGELGEAQRMLAAWVAYPYARSHETRREHEQTSRSDPQPDS